LFRKNNNLSSFIFRKIYDEKFEWPSATRVDHYNDDYVSHKQRDRVIREQKSKIRAQVKKLFFFE
jgi:hypothetical protein